MNGKNTYTVVFHDGPAFRERIKRLLIKVAARAGRMVKQAEVLDMAIEELEKKYP